MIELHQLGQLKTLVFRQGRGEEDGTHKLMEAVLSSLSQSVDNPSFLIPPIT
jgi:hypothetical protein